MALSAGTTSLTPPGQMPLLNRPVTATVGAPPPAGPEELGEQVIKHPPLERDPVDGHPFVSYRIEYQAEDEVLRRGLSIEVRISYDGRIQLANANQYSVMLSDVKDPHVDHRGRPDPAERLMR